MARLNVPAAAVEGTVRAHAGLIVADNVWPAEPVPPPAGNDDKASRAPNPTRSEMDFDPNISLRVGSPQGNLANKVSNGS